MKISTLEKQITVALISGLVLCIAVFINSSRNLDKQCKEESEAIVKKYPELSELRDLFMEDGHVSYFELIRLNEAAEERAIAKGGNK
jgi:uncharacterized protein YpmB